MESLHIYLVHGAEPFETIFPISNLIRAQRRRGNLWPPRFEYRYRYIHEVFVSLGYEQSSESKLVRGSVVGPWAAVQFT